MNFLNKSKDPKKDDKMQAIKVKEAQELKNLNEELNNKKKEGLATIKEKYNNLCTKINIDATALQEAIKNSRIQKVHFHHIFNCYSNSRSQVWGLLNHQSNRARLYQEEIFSRMRVMKQPKHLMGWICCQPTKTSRSCLPGTSLS